MRLADAERDVLSWLDPVRSPRLLKTRYVQSAGNSMAQWTSRGVGFVRRVNPHCSTTYGGHDADELIRYWNPPIKPIEASR